MICMFKKSVTNDNEKLQNYKNSNFSVENFVDILTHIEIDNVSSMGELNNMEEVEMEKQIYEKNERNYCKYFMGKQKHFKLVFPISMYINVFNFILCLHFHCIY